MFFPDKVRFQGLAFLGGKLYATTVEGVLEFEDGRLTALNRWSHDGPTRIQGPWQNRSDGSLWVKESYSLNLRRLHGDDWSAMPLPMPQGAGVDLYSFSIASFRGASDGRGFWLSSPLEAWKWDPAGRVWIAEPLPSCKGVVGVEPVGGGLLAVLWHDEQRLWKDERRADLLTDTAHFRKGGGWQTVPTTAGNIVAAEMIALPSAAFVRTAGTGEVLRIEPDRMTRLPTPGVCEALARSSEGRLLASLVEKGIYELTDAGEWILRHPCPYAPGESGRVVHLAEEGGNVALATNEDPPDTSGQGRRGITALWWIRQGRAQRLRW